MFPKRESKTVKTGAELWQDYLLTFVLEGITPVLLHNAAGMRRQGSEPGIKSIPSPEEEAEAGTYRLLDGTLAFPSIGVRSSILNGASGMRVGTRSLRGILAGALTLTGDELFPFLNGDGESVQTYIVDLRRVVVQRQGIVRARARIDLPWQMPCAFMVSLEIARDMEHFTQVTLSTVINRAGQVAGLGDWRPERTGWLGKYHLHPGSMAFKLL